MEWNTLFSVLLATATWQSAIGQTNLLHNPSFEDDLNNAWKGYGFNMERHSEALDGMYSVKCTDRKRYTDGPVQLAINITEGHQYMFEGYVKLLNNVNGKLWQQLIASILFTFPDEENFVAYIIAYRGFATVQKGWIHLKGSLEAPMKEMINPRLGIRSPDPGVDFLVDNVTLYEVAENPNWMGEAHANIEAYRKSNINFKPIRVSVHRTLNSSLGVIRCRELADMTEADIKDNLADQDVSEVFRVTISLKKHLFAFGTKIEESELVKEPMNQYTKLLFNLFNWATVQSYKWKFNEGGRYNPDFSQATDATKILRDNGLTVRGHSIFWDWEKNTPVWVQRLNDDEVLPELRRHVRYMMNLTRGTLAEWDVQNEHIVGHYYEERLHNPNITNDMFRLTKEQDPNGPTLYLNDFTVVTTGPNTEEFYDLAMEYLAEGVPVEGLGIQGHTKDFVRPSPTAMWRRLDRLAETGLDLMITEFDIRWPDKVVRADWFEDAIRAFFGHPKLKGVILWGFWNKWMLFPDHELVSGPDADNLTIEEPGERWACLTQKEWTTRVIKNRNVTGPNFSVRGFQGDYEVIIKTNGVPVQREVFTLGKEDTAVNITVTQSTTPVEISEKVDYVPQCISHRAERSMGTTAAQSNDTALTCRTVKSATSGIGENDAASVSCRTDEAMTGCFSYHRGRTWRRNGEKMEMDDGGRVQCIAHNGRDSTNGVQEYARCCKVSGLTCDYRTAGPSFPFDGAMAEARCPSGQLALGCSVYQPYPDSDGVKPNANVSSCLAQSGAPAFSSPAERSGAYAFSACCSGSRTLDCRVFVSQESKLRTRKHASVICPSGYAMTGCNVFAASGKGAGARIIVKRSTMELQCKAYLGLTLPAGSTGVTAYATCCKVTA